MTVKEWVGEFKKDFPDTRYEVHIVDFDGVIYAGDLDELRIGLNDKYTDVANRVVENVDRLVYNGKPMLIGIAVEDL